MSWLKPRPKKIIELLHHLHGRKCSGRNFTSQIKAKARRNRQHAFVFTSLLASTLDVCNSGLFHDPICALINNWRASPLKLGMSTIRDTIRAEPAQAYAPGIRDLCDHIAGREPHHPPWSKRSLRRACRSASDTSAQNIRKTPPFFRSRLCGASALSCSCVCTRPSTKFRASASHHCPTPRTFRNHTSSGCVRQHWRHSAGCQRSQRFGRGRHVAAPGWDAATLDGI
jgi:hypothetical protein